MAIEILQSDCLDLMGKMADRSVDAAITDPPYNLNFEYNTYKDDLSAQEYREWCSRWFAELKRVVAGPIALSPGTKNVAMWCGIMPPDGMLCWWKPAAMGHCMFGACNWEPVLVWGKPMGKKSVDVIRAPIVRQLDAAFHPCPKPILFAKGLIERLTREGQTVFDPFCGSGTTAVSAYLTDRKFIGCELDAEYVKKARARVRKMMSAEVNFAA